MAELPSYFEYHLENPSEDGPKFFAFSYDDNEQAFIVGRTAIGVNEFNPYGFLPELDLGAGSDEAIDLRTLLDQSALLPGYSGAIGCPKLHEWARKNPEALGTAREVMHRALTAVIEHPEDIPFEEDEHGFMGYAAANRDNNGESGGLQLQVFGNCACLGPHPDGLYVQYFDHGFAQYDLHNADLLAQQVGLYAGLGHLAKLASEAQT